MVILITLRYYSKLDDAQFTLAKNTIKLIIIIKYAGNDSAIHIAVTTAG